MTRKGVCFFSILVLLISFSSNSIHSASIEFDSHTLTPTSIQSILQITDLIDKANILYYQGNYLESIEVYEEILRKQRSIGDKIGEADTLNNIGVNYTFMGKYDLAFYYYSLSLNIKNNIDDEYGKADTYSNLGDLFSYQNEYEKSLDYYESAIKSKQKIGDKWGESQILFNMGQVSLIQEEYEKAISYFEKSLGICQEENYLSSIASNLNQMCIAYSMIRKNDKAYEYCNDSLDIYTEMGDWISEALVRNNLGMVHSNLKEYKQAIDNYEKSLNIFIEIGDLENQAKTLFNLGLTYFDIYEYPQAKSNLENAQSIYRDIDDKESVASIESYLGELYSNTLDYDRAIKSFQNSYDISREIDDKKGQIRSLINLGVICEKLFDYQKSIEYYQQGLTLSQEIGNKENEAAALHNMGVLFRKTGNYDKALSFYQRSLEIKRSIGDQQNEATTLNSIAIIFDIQGDYDKALLYYFDALNLQRILKDRKSESVTLNNIGTLYKSLDDYDEALKYFQDSLEIKQEILDTNGEASTLMNIGLIHFDRKDYKQAMEYYKKALALQLIIEDYRGEMQTLINLSILESIQNHTNNAKSYLEKALEISRTIGDKEAEEAILINLGALLKNNFGNSSLALDYLLESLFISQDTQIRTDEALILHNIGLLYDDQGQEAKALDYYLRAIQVRENIYASAQVESFQMALANQDMNIYQDAIKLFIKLGRNEEAFNLVERSRARAFLDSIGNNHPDLHQVADADLLEREQALNGELTSLENALISEKSKPINQQNILVIDSISSQLIEKQKEYEELMIQMELSNPELASLVSIPSTTVTDTQSLLDDQATLVSYYLTDENALAFIISKNDFQVVELLASPNEITEAVKNFRNVGLINKNNLHPRSLTDLYTWLIEPLMPHLNTSRVGIIPHQALHYIPFAALSDGKQYLSEQFTLFQLSSASVLPFIQQKTGREITHPLIMGNPQTDNTSLPILEYASEEAKAVADLFGTSALIGAKASEDVLLQKSGNAGVIHLAAHGTFNANAPLFSRLWLAPGDEQDGNLNVHEIYGLDLDQTDLVVLSACQTQLGELSSGDEIVGLNRAFLFGSASVISSLWSVDDEATAVLMEHFYSNLLSGMSKAEALQVAQQAVRTDQNHPEWAHPYYWSAFVLNGDDGMLTNNTYTIISNKVDWILASVIFLILLLVYIVRKCKKKLVKYKK